jgi:cytochrome c oxidase cbb3-type subunit 3
MIELMTTFRSKERQVRVAFWVGTILLIGVSGCDRSDRSKTAARPIPADEVVDFNALFSQNCAGCHGADGMLGPAPPLNDALFLAIVPDGVLSKLVAEGRSGTPMPGFSQKKGGTLTDAQVKVLASGIKSRWPSSQPPPANLPAYASAEKSAGDRQRGQEVFARACAKCHGADGEGTDENAGAINDPAFLELISDQSLRRYVITGRPDLGMPSYAEKTQRPADFQPLKSQDIADVVALLAHWRKADVAPAASGTPASDKKH